MHAALVTTRQGLSLIRRIRTLEACTALGRKIVVDNMIDTRRGPLIQAIVDKTPSLLPLATLARPLVDNQTLVSTFVVLVRQRKGLAVKMLLAALLHARFRLEEEVAAKAVADVL